MHRIHVETGSVFATCDAKRSRAEQHADPGGPTRCNARLHILGIGHGLCLVAELTADEHAYLSSRSRDVLELYEYLGVVATREWIRAQE